MWSQTAKRKGQEGGRSCYEISYRHSVRRFTDDKPTFYEQVTGVKVLFFVFPS
jgi:hypothetical protein